ncbi:Leucine rich repeat-containing protein [Ruminococcus albus]|uniref:Leucine rich repeat-containing protein n=2 Tax=Ruminococcus albus TaxID=1264 RepID=A0A1H7JDL4_RUMAL|nr:Leucine rich repeat-containing protein [Ruminococcus albus]
MVTGYRGTAENVTIPDKLGGYAVQFIGEKAFYKNENIVTVKIPSTVTTIKYGTFAYCKNLKKLDNLKNCSRLCFIEGSAFYECGNLQMKKSDFPSSLYKIDSFAFYNCQKLEGIDLSNAQTIQGSAFDGCESLSSIEAPKTTDYGASVFKDCKNLQNITLSKDIKTLTNRMFQGCSMLKFLSRIQ